MVHPASADEALAMLGAALCEADAERHTGLETAVPCQMHEQVAIRVLESLDRQATQP